MSRHVGGTGRLIAALVAGFGFVGLALASSQQPVKVIDRGAKVAKPIAVTEGDASTPARDKNAPASILGSTTDLPHPGDRCDTAVPLTLNQLVIVTTKSYGVHCELNPARACASDTDCAATDIPPQPNDGVCIKAAAAADDYQTPATTACYSGIGQFPTNATGRDVVFSFTAPATGSYTFKSVQQAPPDDVNAQNSVLYLTDCANSGTVNCLAGANHSITPSFTSSKGGSNNRGDMIRCYPMNSGDNVFLVFDDGIAGRCDDNNHQCFSDSDCATGVSCAPQINPGARVGIEVKPCNSETEPNDTPAQANPYVCDMVGESSVAPAAHCYLGTRAGNVCTRSTFLDQSLPDSNMRCNISGAQCVVDLALGTSDCPPGELCQQQTDLDCDPRCDVGPNAGKSCTTQAFCNPGSDQGATCAGTCQIESTCIDDATGADTGVACTPVCVGGLFPGRYCSSLSGCPGGGVCTATPFVPTPGATCVTGQTCGRQFNEGDTDYFSLGTPASGSLVYAAIDANPSNDFDYRLRVTTDTNTLQMDDDDVTSWYGQNSSVVSGAVTDGTPTYVQVARTIPRTSAPYELYAVVRPPLAAAQLEDESGPTGNDIYYGWPGDVINANPIAPGPDAGYVQGTFAFQGDSDCFKFLVNKGDLMDWFGGANPTRVAGVTADVDIAQPIIYDAEPAGISNYIFGANPRKNVAANVQGAGLRALTPAVTSSWFQWRASYTGMLEVCYYGASAPLSQGTPNHPSPWAGSLSVNCSPVQPIDPSVPVDVSVTKTGPAGPVQAGQFVTYTITVTNNDATHIALEPTLLDFLDANLTFVSLTIDDGLGGNNTACFSLPTQGDPTDNASFPVYCINASLAPGASTTYVLTAQVNNCIGAGVVIPNDAQIFSNAGAADPDNSNDAAHWEFTTVDDGSCQDIACDGVTCTPDLCTNNDHCDAGVCVSDVVNCDDNSLCTDDSCSPGKGCINDSTNAGDLCEDFNPCTTNACDPVLFCVFPPAPAGTSCDDGLSCTTSDQCDGTGTCLGSSVCDDNNPCTDDFADEANACACSHSPAAAGTSCDDGDVCTGTVAAEDACDGAGLCVGGQAISCDDGNACTTDSCDPALGCVHTPLTCDDGDVCNGAETCDTATGCVAGTPLACDDGDACNGVESCDPAAGCVAGTPLVCDDGNACNGSETCDPVAGCLAGTPLVCDDGNACNGSETCNPASGCVAGTPLTCDDGNACNGVETCNPASGCVAGTPLACDDGDACNGSETCNPATGCVGGIPVDCNDDNSCTTDTCDAATGTCSHPANADGSACDDGNACTTDDACDAGTCVGGPAISCPDSGIACTPDVCDPSSGACVPSPTNLDTSGFSASRVDGRDLLILADAWNSCVGDPNYVGEANLDLAGCVDMDDFHLFMNAFGRSCQ